MMQPLDFAANNALYNAEAESSALGGIITRIQNGDKSMIDALSEDDFWLESHRRIYCAARSLVQQGKPIDLITMDEEIGRLYPQTRNEDLQALIQNSVNGLHFINTSAYIAMVQAASMRRKLMSLADELATGAGDRTEDIEVLIDSARAKLRDMVKTSSAWSTMSDVLMATYDDLEKRQKGEIRGIRSGVYDLDRATGGFFPGEFAIIGARPAVGKSALGLQISAQAAMDGYRVCYVSCEMIDSQFGQRLFSRTTDIDGMKLRTAQLQENDWDAIADAMIKYAKLPISFTFGTKTIEALRNDIQKKVDLQECDMVVIDYLQLLGTKRRFEIDHERVGYISHALKQMTTDFKIPVVALAQVKRQNNGGKSRCPVLDELRSSGEIEQDADTVIFLHRPDDSFDPAIDERDRPYYDDLIRTGKQYIAFSVAKQRQGQTGIVGAAFDPAHMRYYALDRVR